MAGITETEVSPNPPIIEATNRRGSPIEASASAVTITTWMNGCWLRRFALIKFYKNRRKNEETRRSDTWRPERAIQRPALEWHRLTTGQSHSSNTRTTGPKRAKSIGASSASTTYTVQAKWVHPVGGNGCNGNEEGITITTKKETTKEATAWTRTANGSRWGEWRQTGTVIQKRGFYLRNSSIIL